MARVCACGPGQLGEGGGRALQVHARPRCPHAPARALAPLHQSGVGAENGMGEPRAESGTSGQSLYLRRRVWEKLRAKGRARVERTPEAGWRAGGGRGRWGPARYK